MKLDKCDKCGKRAERYQCGNVWLCGQCYPRDRAKQMYPLWTREKKAEVKSNG